MLRPVTEIPENNRSIHLPRKKAETIPSAAPETIPKIAVNTASSAVFFHAAAKRELTLRC